MKLAGDGSDSNTMWKSVNPAAVDKRGLLTEMGHVALGIMREAREGGRAFDVGSVVVLVKALADEGLLSRTSVLRQVTVVMVCMLVVKGGK